MVSNNMNESRMRLMTAESEHYQQKKMPENNEHDALNLALQWLGDSRSNIKEDGSPIVDNEMRQVLDMLRKQGYLEYLALNRKQLEPFIETTNPDDRPRLHAVLKDIEQQRANRGFNWQAMSQKLSSNIGNLMMVIHYKEEDHSCGIRGPRTPSLHHRVELAVISDHPKLEDRDLIVPCEKYLQAWEDWDSIEKLLENKGPLKISELELLYLGIPVGFYIGREVESYHDLREGLFILVGEEVKDYLEFPKPKTQYHRALEMLGLESPQTLAKKHAEELAKKRCDILTSLEQAVPSAEVYRTKFLEAKNTRNEFVTSDADAFFASGPEQEAYRLTSGVVQSLLKQALEIGLHNVYATVTVRPGVVITPADYLMPLFEQYKVEVPK